MTSITGTPYKDGDISSDEEQESRAASPIPSSEPLKSCFANQNISTTCTPLPDSVKAFFSQVSTEGFPKPANTEQPWKRLVTQEPPPSRDGSLIVACPKRCDYGSNNLGGF